MRSAGTTNLAWIGQYCKIVDDVAFVGQYSVLSPRLLFRTRLASVGARHRSKKGGSIRVPFFQQARRFRIKSRAFNVGTRHCEAPTSRSQL